MLFPHVPAGMNTEQVEHLNHVLEHVRQAHPFFNRTGGRDHFFVSRGGRAGRRGGRAGAVHLLTSYLQTGLGGCCTSA